MKAIISSIIFALVLIGGALWFAGSQSGSTTAGTPSRDNVSVVDGVQIIDIKVKGGYEPRSTVAKADIPTVIRFTTSGTFDCSIAVRIPSLGLGENLSMNGALDMPIGTSTPGILKGTCSMGMYGFEVDFQN
ncbi:MAG: hypothetical protein KBC33_00280 [Candidatus Pacebacteria bacterium]|nr:hypothetical protein [Candidatus Paceibacterota bacterium]